MGTVFHEEKKLLELLAAKAGCAYLSDLHAPEWAGELEKALEKTPPDLANATEWNEAARYIAGGEREFSSAKEAREYLIEYSKIVSGEMK